MVKCELGQKYFIAFLTNSIRARAVLRAFIEVFFFYITKMLKIKHRASNYLIRMPLVNLKPLFCFSFISVRHKNEISFTNAIPSTKWYLNRYGLYQHCINSQVSFQFLEYEDIRKFIHKRGMGRMKYIILRISDVCLNLLAENKHQQSSSMALIMIIRIQKYVSDSCCW